MLVDDIQLIAAAANEKGTGELAKRRQGGKTQSLPRIACLRPVKELRLHQARQRLARQAIRLRRRRGSKLTIQVMGIGGGKSIDTAKGVANELQLPVVIIPTSASTDAPTSALSVIYKENHEHSPAINYIKSPDMVLIDSTISKVHADATGAKGG